MILFEATRFLVSNGGSGEVHSGQLCEEGAIFTYNSPDKPSGGVSLGGYSESIVADDMESLKQAA